MEITKVLYPLLGKEVLVKYYNKKVVTTISAIENNGGTIVFILANSDKIASDTISSFVYNDKCMTIGYNGKGQIVFEIV